VCCRVAVGLEQAYLDVPGLDVALRLDFALRWRFGLRLGGDLSDGVLHLGVRPWEEQARVPRAGPLHNVGRGAVLVPALDDPSVPKRMVKAVGRNHYPVTYGCFHGALAANPTGGWALIQPTTWRAAGLGPNSRLRRTMGVRIAHLVAAQCGNVARAPGGAAHPPRKIPKRSVPFPRFHNEALTYEGEFFVATNVLPGRRRTCERDAGPRGIPQHSIALAPCDGGAS
jgi:hypothetical protein